MESVSKKRIFTTLILTSTIGVCFAFSSGIAGKWIGKVRTPDGNEFALTYNFKVDSGKATGTLISPMGEFTIGNVTMINATDFTFALPINGVNVKNVGKYYPKADSIGMDIENNGITMHATLTRSPSN